MSLEDQLLMTLMKLRLSSPDLDLAHRFCLSRASVHIMSFIHAMHEILIEGITEKGIPSQAKCKGSLPASFEFFTSARIIIDATEISQV